MKKLSSSPSVAIVGATGLVGNEMLVVLEERKLPVGKLKLLASKDSTGEVYRFRDDEIVVEELTEQSFSAVDLALFATSADLAAAFVPKALDSGAIVIDNSSLYRMDPEVPLVVPEVNLAAVTSDTRLIANPNCSTIQLVPVLHALHELAGLEHVIVSTYQSVSGAGKDALDELWAQSLAIFNQQEMPQEVFQHQIAFNCIPHIDLLLDNGFTREEMKIVDESRKILGLPNLRISATAVRVPVFYGHAESVFVECSREFSVQGVVDALAAMPGIVVHPSGDEYPMQIEVAGTDDIHVGRIRKDPSVRNGVSLWVVADNVRKGAALNAIQIAEYLVSQQ
jgi:aspartate-semialdehyde dehydrogenase